MLPLLPLTVAAQQQIPIAFQVGQLAYVEAAEPSGWLCFDRAVVSEREGRRCYVSTTPGTFKLAALSRTNVGEVTAIYTVTVGTGPVTPTPSPTPVPPGPAPNVPNDLGLGALAYTQALAAGEPAVASSLSQMYASAAAALERQKAAGEVSVDVMRQVAKAINEQFLARTKGTPAWMAWRREVHGRINSLQDSRQPPGWTGDDWIAACREIAAALGQVR